MNPPQPTPDRQLQFAEERTRAAYQRTILAEERTYSAWIRSGLASAAAGFAIVELLSGSDPAWLVQALGVLFVLAGGFMFVLGFWGYQSALRKLEQRPAGGIPVWVLGVLSLALLAGTLAGLWLVLQD